MSWWVAAAGLLSVLAGIPAFNESLAWTNYCEPYNTALGVAAMCAQWVILVAGLVLLLGRWSAIGLAGRALAILTLPVATSWAVITLNLGTPFNGWPSCTN